MESHSQNPHVGIYRVSRWPTRLVAAFFLAIGVVFFVVGGVVVLLVVFGAMGGLFLVAGERRRVRVTSEGVTSVPPLGRSRSFPWSSIDGFAARPYFAKYSGWVVSMSVQGTWIDLEGTRRASTNARARAAVDATVERLNRDLADARGRR